MLNLSAEASFSSIRKTATKSFLGRGEYLSRTENLIHALGSVTVLCCTDKKGLLSWPNTSAEKIFILKDRSRSRACAPERQASGSGGDGISMRSETIGLPTTTAERDGRASKTGSNVTTEILTTTQGAYHPFKMDFDDPTAVKEFESHLKPLGLSIALNTCNISTEEKYTNFFNHLICESMRIGEEHLHLENHSSPRVEEESPPAMASQHKIKSARHCGGIEVLPIVTRGCLCELASNIGFHPQDVNQFKMTNQIQTFRYVKGGDDAGTKFVRKLQLTRLKYPFPHMVSVLVHQRNTSPGDSHHLISQGTADLVLDSCIDAWTGADLEPLNEDLRKKILDFYERASLSAYCTAFSYRPLTLPFPWSSVQEYLQLPANRLPYYWQHAVSADCADFDAIQKRGHISAGTTSFKNMEEAREGQEQQGSKDQQDAQACLQLECNQTFLGMVQLQYQPMVDIVQLIDLLEKACIRFVHFSKENELRSKVFSEKLGLETGWNCHISLRSNKPGSDMRRTVSYFCPADNCVPGQPRQGKRAAVAASRRNWRIAVGSSLPDKLDRNTWHLDILKWQEAHRVVGRRESRSSQADVREQIFCKNSTVRCNIDNSFSGGQRP